MDKYEFEMVDITGEDRPVIRIPSFGNLLALIDTGADIPVWTRSEEGLKKLCGDKSGIRSSYGGFGGQVSCNVYRMDFQLGGLKYPKMPIATGYQSNNFALLLSATMFTNLILIIDSKMGMVTIAVPDGEGQERHLQMSNSNGRLHVFLNQNRY